MLTKNAILNTIQLAIDQISRILVNFFLIPILVTSLGSVGFGLWQILQRTSLQFSTLDGRAPEVLKWVIAGQQNHDDIESKQRAIGSALFSLLFFLPLLVSVYAGLVWLLPNYIDVKEDSISEARYVIIILGFSALLLIAANIYEAIIRGMNIAYKLLGIQAVVLIGGGGASAFAVIEGYGLLGLAAAQVITSMFYIASYCYIAKKNIFWLGIKKPTWQEVKQAFHRSKWYTVWAFVAMWMLTGDVIILGMLEDSAMVSQYILTMYLPQMITVVILTAISAVMPGVAGIIGSGENKRAKLLIQESFLYGWWFSVAICCTIIVFNKSFVGLWVGSEHYAGNNINALITVSILQLVIIRQSADMLNVALDIRKKVVIGFLSAAVTLVLMVVLIPIYHLYGLCAALLIGRFPLQVFYPKIINKFLKVNNDQSISMRRIFVTPLLLVFSWYISNYAYVDTWLNLLFKSGMFFLIVIWLLYVIGIDEKQKTTIQARYNLVKSML